jgi:hypothetical protein
VIVTNLGIACVTVSAAEANPGAVGLKLEEWPGAKFEVPGPACPGRYCPAAADMISLRVRVCLFFRVYF